MATDRPFGALVLDLGRSTALLVKIPIGARRCGAYALHARVGLKIPSPRKFLPWGRGVTPTFRPSSFLIWAPFADEGDRGWDHMRAKKSGGGEGATCRRSRKAGGGKGAEGRPRARFVPWLGGLRRRGPGRGAIREFWTNSPGNYETPNVIPRPRRRWEKGRTMRAIDDSSGCGT